MKDWLFFPLAVALIAGIVGYALSHRDHIRIDVASGFSVEADALAMLYPAEGTKTRLAKTKPTETPFAVMSAHLSLATAPPSAGVFTTLNKKFETEFSEKKIRVSIVARQGRVNPARTFAAGYFTAEVGDSGWHHYDLTKDYATYAFEFTPGQQQEKPGNDYVGIWPDVGGNERTIDVLSIRVDLADKPRAPASPLKSSQ